MNEPAIIRTLFEKLQAATLQRFPAEGQKFSAPTQPGIYVLYGSRGKVRYVGQARGSQGLRARLMAHLNHHWHTAKYGSKFRTHGSFRCLVVQNERQRALLEAYATGCLCPAYMPQYWPSKAN